MNWLPGLVTIAQGGVRCAPGCSVHPWTEEHLKFLKEGTMTPRPLRAIKGTSRRPFGQHKCNKQVHTSSDHILSLPLLCISVVCVESQLWDFRERGCAAESKSKSKILSVVTMPECCREDCK
jgi:hypothetical protein